MRAARVVFGAILLSGELVGGVAGSTGVVGEINRAMRNDLAGDALTIDVKFIGL